MSGAIYYGRHHTGHAPLSVATAPQTPVPDRQERHRKPRHSSVHSQPVRRVRYVVGLQAIRDHEPYAPLTWLISVHRNEPVSWTLAIGSIGSTVDLSYAIIDPLALMIHAIYAQALLR